MKLRKLLPLITLKFLGGGKLWLGIFRKIVFDEEIGIDDGQGDYDPSADIPKYPLVLNLRLIPSDVNDGIREHYTTPQKLTFDEFVELFGESSFKTIPESKKKWDGTVILIDEFDRTSSTIPDTSKVINTTTLGIDAQYVYHDTGNICAYWANYYPIRIQTDISNGDIYVWYTNQDDTSEPI